MLSHKHIKYKTKEIRFFGVKSPFNLFAIDIPGFAKVLYALAIILV